MENIFIEIDGRAGESTSAQTKAGIELYSFSHSVSMPLSAGASATGRTHGRTHHQDITITKRLDKTSPLLNLDCSTGNNIKTATIRVFGASDADKPVEYYNIKINDIIVTSISVGAGGGDRPIETVTLNYQEIIWTYSQHNHDAGGAKGNVVSGFDLQKNTKK
jgi:type VI secretion system secreted protein Hcp